MNDNDYALNIQIIYNNKDYSIDGIKEMITLEELKEKSLNVCNIKNKYKDSIIFTYKDEQGDINMIENFEDIIKVSEESNKEELLSKINLEIIKSNSRYNKKKKNNEENLLKNKYTNENTNLIEKLLKKNKEKDDKIELLNNIILNLKKECSNKITKMKSLMKKKLNDIIINYFENKIKDSIDDDDVGNIKKGRNNENEMVNKILSETQNLREIINNISTNLKKNENILEKIEYNLSHKNENDINSKNNQKQDILPEGNNIKKNISINEKNEDEKSSNEGEKKNEINLAEKNNEENDLNEVREKQKKMNENKKKNKINNNNIEKNDISDDNISNEMKDEEKIDESIKNKDKLIKENKYNKISQSHLKLDKVNSKKIKKYNTALFVNKNEENYFIFRTKK